MLLSLPTKPILRVQPRRRDTVEHTLCTFDVLVVFFLGFGLGVNGTLFRFVCVSNIVPLHCRDRVEHNRMHQR